jgi:serine/threonine protein kinase
MRALPSHLTVALAMTSTEPTIGETTATRITPVATKLVGASRTQLGTASAMMVRAHARPPKFCPECSAPFGDGPFCKQDGTLAEGFDVGERYRVEELLGAGGTSFVFGARHLALGKSVAVKLLRPELAADADHTQRFLAEACLAGQIAHENVAAVTDYGDDRALALPFVVMARLRGPSLASVMEEHGKLPHARALPILVQLARAVAALHEQGVAHGDLAAKSVALEESSGRRDVVKLCGVGRAIADEAPAAADIYAIGEIACAMLAGGRAGTATAIERELREVAPPALASVIARCLVLDPAARPRAAELATMLTQVALPNVGMAEPTEIVGRMIGSYRVIEQIGAGGMGSVYRAEHPEIGTQVAIKVLLPEIAGSTEVIERFVREARASSAIGSPHIPRYHDFGRLPDGRAYAVMELLSGETLAARLARTGPMTIEQTAAILRTAAAALGEAHALGIVHRDVKPENLFFAYDARGNESVKVLDFGIAKVSAATRERLTQHGSFVGTPIYCAPEQVFGDAVGPATDVYALGATAFEMLTGRPAFEGDLSDVFAANGNAAPPSVRAVMPAVPLAVDATISRALAPHASARFASMQELERSVAAWSEAGIAASPPRKRSWIALAAAPAAISVLALAGLGLWLAPDAIARREAIAPAVTRATVTSAAIPVTSVPPTVPVAPAPRVEPPAPRVEPTVPTLARAPEVAAAPTAARAPEVVPAAPARPARARPRRSERPAVATPLTARDPARPIIADPFAP